MTPRTSLLSHTLIFKARANKAIAASAGAMFAVFGLAVDGGITGDEMVQIAVAGFTAFLTTYFAKANVDWRVKKNDSL